MTNTPGTRGGSGFRDRMLAEKEENRPKIIFFCKKLKLQTKISSTYAKIWGKQNSRFVSFPKWVKCNIRRNKERRNILKGLGWEFSKVGNMFEGPNHFPTSKFETPSPPSLGWFPKLYPV